MERKLIEIRQDHFQGWVCSECGCAFLNPACALDGMTLDQILQHFKTVREQAFSEHRCPGS